MDENPILKIISSAMGELHVKATQASIEKLCKLAQHALNQINCEVQATKGRIVIIEKKLDELNWLTNKEVLEKKLENFRRNELKKNNQTL